MQCCDGYLRILEGLFSQSVFLKDLTNLFKLFGLNVDSCKLQRFFWIIYFASNPKLALILKSSYPLDTYLLRRCRVSDQGKDTFLDVHLSNGSCSFTMLRLSFPLYMCIFVQSSCKVLCFCFYMALKNSGFDIALNRKESRKINLCFKFSPLKSKV